MKATYKRGVAGGFGREIDFRKNVLDFFNHTCVLCDEYLKYEMYSSAEAAHIVPRASRGVNKVDNSFCLCKEHHWSFDKGFWSVSDSGDIILSSRLSNNENFILKYRKFEGKKIHYDILSKINLDALTWHRENIFK
jgi:putative restriction endonuclease